MNLFPPCLNDNRCNQRESVYIEDQCAIISRLSVTYWYNGDIGISMYPGLPALAITLSYVQSTLGTRLYKHVAN